MNCFGTLRGWRLAISGFGGVATRFGVEAPHGLICDKPEVKRDFRFAGQLRDAAASGPANIAEGFGRNFHPEFARFGRIARASEIEVMNHMIDARGRGYVNDTEFDQVDHAAKKALKAVNGLIRIWNRLRNSAANSPQRTRCTRYNLFPTLIVYVR